MAFVGFPVLGFGSPYFDSLIEVYQFFKYIIPLNPTCCCFIVAVFPVKCQAVLHSNINHHSPLTFPLKISFLSSSFFLFAWLLTFMRLLAKPSFFSMCHGNEIFILSV